MIHAWISLLVFVLCYALFVVLPARRSWTACIGGALLVATGVLDWKDALFVKISWNVMGLFFGTLILAELFLMSRVPALLAEWLVDKSKSTRVAMLALCTLAGVISMFVENVAVVLLVAPVALSLADKLKISPVKLLIGIAISSNLQGTATMIGDPPSMILAGYMRMGFWDFFAYHGRPGIFFAAQIGAIASLVVLAFVYRRHSSKPSHLRQETARSWVPATLLGLLILGLSFATVFDPEFAWFAGVYTLGLSAIALAWYRLHARWGSTRKLITAPHQQIIAREAGDAVHLVGQKALNTSGAGEKKLELVHRGYLWWCRCMVRKAGALPRPAGPGTGAAAAGPATTPCANWPAQS